MKKRIWLAVILVLLSLAFWVVTIEAKDSYQGHILYDWIGIAGYMMILYVLFAIMLPDKYQFIKFIPSMLILVFYVFIIIDFYPDPDFQNPFGPTSMVYTAILGIFLMSVVDLMKNDYQGFKIFVAMMMLALNAYGIYNTLYYFSLESQGLSPREIYDALFMGMTIFQLPFFIFFLETFYQKVTLRRREEVKAQADIPYNRYRPDDTPTPKQDSTEQPKTSAQLQREKNALHGITMLYEAGLLTDEEFERKKKRILSGK